MIIANVMIVVAIAVIIIVFVFAFIIYLFVLLVSIILYYKAFVKQRTVLKLRSSKTAKSYSAF